MGIPAVVHGRNTETLRCDELYVIEVGKTPLIVRHTENLVLLTRSVYSEIAVETVGLLEDGVCHFSLQTDGIWGFCERIGRINDLFFSKMRSDRGEDETYQKQ